MPGKLASAAAAATSTASTATATSPAKPSAISITKPNKGSLTITSGTITLPKLSIVPAASAAATAKSPITINLTNKSGHRKLLSFGWGASAGPTALQDATEQQIQDAVDGDDSVADVGQEAVSGSEDLSVPGTANLADEGIYVSAAQTMLMNG
jgi:hypothetical protein